MIRITILEIASFLLPFALFLIWSRLSNRAPEAGRMPTLRLAAVGAVLAILVMVVLVIIETNKAGHEGDRYVPPQNIDGRIIPGHFVPAEDDGDGDDAGREGEAVDPQ